jgi:hypothetical protein
MSRTRLTCKMRKLKSINRSPLKKTKFLGQWVTFSSEIRTAPFFIGGVWDMLYISTAPLSSGQGKICSTRDIRMGFIKIKTYVCSAVDCAPFGTEQDILEVQLDVVLDVGHRVCTAGAV